MTLMVTSAAWAPLETCPFVQLANEEAKKMGREDGFDFIGTASTRWNTPHSIKLNFTMQDPSIEACINDNVADMDAFQVIIADAASHQKVWTMRELNAKVDMLKTIKIPHPNEFPKGECATYSYWKGSNN